MRSFPANLVPAERLRTARKHANASRACMQRLVRLVTWLVASEDELLSAAGVRPDLQHAMWLNSMRSLCACLDICTGVRPPDPTPI